MYLFSLSVIVLRPAASTLETEQTATSQTEQRFVGLLAALDARTLEEALEDLVVFVGQYEQTTGGPNQWQTEPFLQTSALLSHWISHSTVDVDHQ